ncbi:MAG: acyl-CoA dehydrogenase family protein [Deltaproteobacteria bacterium]|nr:acyl-CoA dehydrogenase family protein [Deltaproteobacteria bacterium]
MSSLYFMEDLYLGSLNERMFRAFSPAEPSTRVKRLVNDYHDLMKDYDVGRFEKDGRIPDEVLKRLGALGLFGINIPEAYGGLGFSLTEYLQFIEEAIKLDVSTALTFMSHTSLGVQVLLLFGDERQKNRYLVPAATGEKIMAFGLTEPDTGSDARNLQTSAEPSPDGGHYILSGTKAYITNANYAGAITVFAQMDPKKPGHMGVFIVETDWKGVEIGENMPKMGLRASSTAFVRLDRVSVPVENLVGKPGEGFKIAMTILNYGRLKLGAAAVGLLDQSLKDMKKRAAARLQFGQPIRNFPLIQEKLVQARVRRFVSSAMNEFAAAILEKAPKFDPAIETSHCKLFGTTRVWDTLYDALQVAGGSGYLSTQPYERRMRDMRAGTLFEGTTEIHSIYPPLFLLGKLNKRSDMRSKNPISRLLFLIRKAFGRDRWPLVFEDEAMRKASALARANVKTLKRMFFLGLLLHGKSFTRQQFLLRRWTTLSMVTYGLLAILASLSARQRHGCLEREDRELLLYFIEEAREVRKKNKRLLPDKKERLHRVLFERMASE